MTVTWVAGKCFLGSGWGAVVRDMGLEAGQRVLLEATCVEPWQLKISLLPGTSFLGAHPLYPRKHSAQALGFQRRPQPNPARPKIDHKSPQ